jgi:hypothetical protein
MRLPRFRPVTVVLLSIVALLLLWANLQTSAGWKDFGAGIGAPTELDPVTRYFFSRGWPLSPFWVCLVEGMKFRPGGIAHLALALNVLIAGLLLALTAVMSEWLARRVEHQRIRPITDVPPSIVVFCLFWANLQTSAGWDELGASAPTELDPITQYFFSRGWPVSPWRICSYHENRFYPDWGPVRSVPVWNGILACLILVATVALSEWLPRHVNRLMTSEQCDTDALKGDDMPRKGPP